MVTAPGPGEYTSKSFLDESNASMHFGRQSRPKARVDKMPGPGEYDVKTDNKSLSTSARNVFFGTSAKGTRNHKDKTPGPGEYSLRSDFVSVDNNTAQNMTVNLGRKANYSFSREPRVKKETKLDREIKANPGPGEYTVRNPELESKFSKTRVAQIHNDTSVKRSNRKIGRDLPFDDRLSRTQHQPGPGTYKDKHLGSPGLAISRESRHIKIGETKLVPGPGQYNVSMAHVQHHERTAYISPDKRERSIGFVESRTPGPGHYQSISQFDNDDSKHFTIG